MRMVPVSRRAWRRESATKRLKKWCCQSASVGVGLLSVSVPLPSLSFFLFLRVSQSLRACGFWSLRCLCGVSKIELRDRRLWGGENLRKRKRFWPLVVEGGRTCRVSCRGPRPTLGDASGKNRFKDLVVSWLFTSCLCCLVRRLVFYSFVHGCMFHLIRSLGRLPLDVILASWFDRTPISLRLYLRVLLFIGTDIRSRTAAFFFHRSHVCWWRLEGVIVSVKSWLCGCCGSGIANFISVQWSHPSASHRQHQPFMSHPFQLIHENNVCVHQTRSEIFHMKQNNNSSQRTRWTWQDGVVKRWLQHLSSQARSELPDTSWQCSEWDAR